MRLEFTSGAEPDPVTGEERLFVALLLDVDEFINPSYNRTMLENMLGKHLLALLKSIRDDKDQWANMQNCHSDQKYPNNICINLGEGIK